MATMDTILFEQFVECLNTELSAIGATIRVARERSATRGTMMLQDASGQLLGAVPDHVDAPTLLSFEAILAANSAP